ncbi:Uncharacterized protein conserved in bacteria [Aerococcus viridans]|nr:Uncharacterized protein conserved in bacteria [Aerococcus viridans]
MEVLLKNQANIFSDEIIHLKHKNFIFGKNGSGKSTLCSLIMQQKHFAAVKTNKYGKLVENLENGERILIENQDNKFDVRIFQGFESVIGEDETLNAIALSGENKNVAEQVKIAEEVLQKLLSEKKQINNELIKAKVKFNSQDDKIDKWLISASKSIKENTQYRIDGNYNKSKFKKDIINAKRIDNLEELTAIIKEEPKETIENYEFNTPDYENLLSETNTLLSKTVELTYKCAELDTTRKENFAKEGLGLHKEGDTCLFCGGVVTLERLEMINQHFNREYRDLEKEISNFNLETISLEKLDQRYFYANFIVAELNQEIQLKEKEINDFIDQLQRAINQKKNDITKVFDSLSLDIPDLSSLQSRINILINENNLFGKNLNENIADAKRKIKYHLAYEYCEKFGYQVELRELENLKKAIPDISEVETKIALKRKEIQNLKNQQKDTSKIAYLINERLSKSGKRDLKLVKVEEDGFERYEIHNGENNTRPINQVSTGEKNIIAFLYFIFSLDNTETTNTFNKIIIFDDPMNSNDDTMQYLIISELLKLHQGKTLARFNPSEDYFLCLTHNVHFYLNIQPHGSYKDQKGKTKYDKNNFFRIENKQFKLITSEKEDFKTNYAGLWIELKELCKNNFRYSMLNSMRRIIETFIKFNNLNHDLFYRGNEHYLKLFNVNSHAIDDFDQDQFTETSEELKELFKQLFVENGFEAHFNNYWKIPTE